MKDRCPTCGSSNPMFTDCKDRAVAKEETGRDFPDHPPGCGDPWHDDPASKHTGRGSRMNQPAPTQGGIGLHGG